MKQITKTITGLFCLMMIAGSVISQDNTGRTVAWVSEKGYWNSETNIHDPLNHIIRFFTNDGKLVHTEKLSSIKLNFDKRKTKMKLKKALEQTLELYSRKEPPQHISEHLVAYLK